MKGNGIRTVRKQSRTSHSTQNKNAPCNHKQANDVYHIGLCSLSSNFPSLSLLWALLSTLSMLSQTYPQGRNKLFDLHSVILADVLLLEFYFPPIYSILSMIGIQFHHLAYVAGMIFLLFSFWLTALTFNLFKASSSGMSSCSCLTNTTILK